MIWNYYINYEKLYQSLLYVTKVGLKKKNKINDLTALQVAIEISWSIKKVAWSFFAR